MITDMKQNTQHECNLFICFLAYSAAWVWQRFNINQGWKSYSYRKIHTEKGRGVEDSNKGMMFNDEEWNLVQQGGNLRNKGGGGDRQGKGGRFNSLESPPEVRSGSGSKYSEDEPEEANDV